MVRESSCNALVARGATPPAPPLGLSSCAVRNRDDGTGGGDLESLTTGEWTVACSHSSWIWEFSYFWDCIHASTVPPIALKIQPLFTCDMQDPCVHGALPFFPVRNKLVSSWDVCSCSQLTWKISTGPCDRSGAQQFFNPKLEKTQPDEWSWLVADPLNSTPS